MSDRSENPFQAFGLPPVPDGLREASLRAASRVFRTAPPADFWTRLARSRAARLAWAACVTLFFILHLALPGRTGRERLASPPASRLDPEVSAVVALPRIDERALGPYSGGRS